MVVMITMMMTMMMMIEMIMIKNKMMIMIKMMVMMMKTLQGLFIPAIFSFSAPTLLVSVSFA